MNRKHSTTQSRKTVPWALTSDRVARYYDVLSGEKIASRAAWAYDEPTSGFAGIGGYVAFYAAQMDEAWVGNARVIPQPGNFYGGWVTPNLEGQIKGAPGTQHW